MAPECIEEKSYSKKSDVWAFGITLTEVKEIYANAEFDCYFVQIFTREDPYKGIDGVLVAAQIYGKEIQPIIPDNVPTLYQEIMKQCFEWDARDRPDFNQICELLPE